MSTKSRTDAEAVGEIYDTTLPKFVKVSLAGKTEQIHNDFQRHINMLEGRVMEICGKDKEKVLKAVRDVFKEYLE